MMFRITSHGGGNTTGGLVAGLLNQVKGQAKCIHVAGVVNKSGDAHMQIAGLINIARRVEGVQLAGLVNIAEQSDYPIGLINIIRDGERTIGLTVDETGGSMLA